MAQSNIKKGYVPPIVHENDPESINRALEDVTRMLAALQDGLETGEVVVRSTGGGVTGVPSSGTGSLVPRKQVAVEVYYYDPDNPGAPSVKIGETTTNYAGLWELDLAANGVDRSTFVTVLVGGEVKVPNPIYVNGPFYRDPDSGDLLPVMLGGQEITTS